MVVMNVMWEVLMIQLKLPFLGYNHRLLHQIVIVQAASLLWRACCIPALCLSTCCCSFCCHILLIPRLICFVQMIIGWSVTLLLCNSVICLSNEIRVWLFSIWKLNLSGFNFQILFIFNTLCLSPVLICFISMLDYIMEVVGQSISISYAT